MVDEKNISEEYGNPQDGSLRGFNLLDQSEKKFTERWTGKVVNNEDPLKMGRVRVRVFGFYDKVKDVMLPWALPECGYVGASTSNLVVPEVDTNVRGYFENGDPYKPIYTGMITVENPAVAKAEAFLGMRSAGDTILEEATNSQDYPNVMVLMKTDDGEAVTLNKATGLMKINHRSGLKIQIDPNGSIHIEQSMSKKIVNNEPANMDVEIEGKFNLTAKDQVNMKAEKDVNIDAVLGDVNLGRNKVKQLVCTNPACFVTGAPTNGGNTNVKA